MWHLLLISEYNDKFAKQKRGEQDNSHLPLGSLKGKLFLNTRYYTVIQINIFKTIIDPLFMNIIKRTEDAQEILLIPLGSTQL